MQTIILLLIFGAILPVFFLGTKGIILNFLGAEGAIYKGADDYITTILIGTIILLLIFGAILPVFFLGTKGIILNFLGAEGAIYKGADDYITTILIGGMLPVLGNGLNPIS